jgi:hypothetical protein
MKINLVFLFLITVFQVKTQGSDFISIRPIMDSLKSDLIGFREEAKGNDITINKISSEHVVLKYSYKQRIETIEFVYDSIKLYHWQAKGRTGLVKYNNGIEINYIIKRKTQIKRIVFKESEANIIVKNRFGKPVIKNLPDYYRPKDEEILVKLFLNFLKELPI